VGGGFGFGKVGGEGAASGRVRSRIPGRVQGTFGGEASGGVEAAQGEALDAYARNIAETVDIAANPDLVQRFCTNGLGVACPEGIAARLGDYGYASGGTGVDLAHAFVVMVADQKDGNPDLLVTDEDYLASAYHVALGRDPDTSGAADNLRFIQDTGNRKAMLRTLLQSEEFKKQS
jgi:hypothetical protein